MNHVNYILDIIIIVVALFNNCNFSGVSYKYRQPQTYPEARLLFWKIHWPIRFDKQMVHVHVWMGKKLFYLIIKSCLEEFAFFFKEYNNNVTFYFEK